MAKHTVAQSERCREEGIWADCFGLGEEESRGKPIEPPRKGEGVVLFGVKSLLLGPFLLGLQKAIAGVAGLIGQLILGM